MERWLEIAGWPGHHVSDLGRVSRDACILSGRCFKKRFLKIYVWTDQRGHKRLYVCLRTNGEDRQHRTVGRLVLETFAGLPEEGQECRHLDDDYRNCALKNLVWGTHLENARDAVRNGRVPRGEKAGKAKLTDDAVRYIRRVYKPWSREYGHVALASMFDVSVPTVKSVVNRRSWSHIRRERVFLE